MSHMTHFRDDRNPVPRNKSNLALKSCYMHLKTLTPHLTLVWVKCHFLEISFWVESDVLGHIIYVKKDIARGTSKCDTHELCIIVQMHASQCKIKTTAQGFWKDYLSTVRRAHESLVLREEGCLGQAKSTWSCFNEKTLFVFLIIFSIYASQLKLHAVLLDIYASFLHWKIACSMSIWVISGGSVYFSFRWWVRVL